MIMKCARLKTPPGDDQLLFDKNSGVGLDSIDVLELVVGLEKTFGITIKDWETGQRVLRSVATIADFVRQNGKPR